MAGEETLRFRPTSEVPPGPSTDVIKKIKSLGFIKEQSPLWWSTDYEPDPREYVNFEDFQQRLVHFENVKIKRAGRPVDNRIHTFNIDLYPHPDVPISIVKLEVWGEELPFMVTARPYHEKERRSLPFTNHLYEHPTIEDITEFVKNDGIVELHAHFYPHIGGLYAGKRGNNFFWYPVWPFGYNPPHDLNGDFINRHQELRGALEKKGLSHLGIHNATDNDPYSYSGVWPELDSVRFDSKHGGRLVDLSFPTKGVSAEEFIEDYNKNEDLMVMHPARLDGFKHTLPLVITNKTQSTSRQRHPAILGVYADNTSMGRTRHRGIARIKDQNIAEALASQVTEDFKIPVDAILFTPQKGKPQYQRLPATLT